MKISSKIFSYDKIFPKGQICTPSAEIRQIAELSLIRSGEITAHIQKCDEITYVISGKATIYSGTSCFSMQAGQVHFIKEGETHRIVADNSENFHYCCIGYHPVSSCDSIRSFLDATQNCRSFLVEDTGSIRRLFSLLIDEFYIRDEESNEMVHLYFCQMLIILYRILSGKSKRKLNKQNKSASNYAVYQALKYIDREYLNITQVKEIAEHLSYNECYLCHIFKEKMEMTLKEYLMQKKLITAIELLQSSNMKISDIADQLHFTSLHAFDLAFKRYTGSTPSQYRKELVCQNNTPASQ